MRGVWREVREGRLGAKGRPCPWHCRSIRMPRAVQNATARSDTISEGEFNELWIFIKLLKFFREFYTNIYYLSMYLFIYCSNYYFICIVRLLIDIVVNLFRFFHVVNILINLFFVYWKLILIFFFLFVWSTLY